MLSEQEIQKVLHASRVLPLAVPNPHGPLGLEHVAQVVAQIQGGVPESNRKNVRPLDVPLEMWHKLERLAEAAAKRAARPVSVAEVANAILRNYVSANE